MAQNDILKRYLEAGLAFTQMTRERAEEFVQALVKAGEVRRKEAQQNIDELVEWSRRNSEELVAVIRREVTEQLRRAGINVPGAGAGSGGTESETPNAADSTDPVPAAAAATVKAAAKKAAATGKKAAPKKAGSTKKAAKKSS